MMPFISNSDCHYFGERLNLLGLLPWSTPSLFGMNLVSIPAGCSSGARAFRVPCALELAYPPEKLRSLTTDRGQGSPGGAHTVYTMMIFLVITSVGKHLHCSWLLDQRSPHWCS